jgi:hypothetical protein
MSAGKRRRGRLTRREFLLAGAGASALALGIGLAGPGREARAAPLDLEVFRQGYPRGFFFRQTERDARSGEYTFEEWEKMYLPLGGIMGKVLNEEHDYSNRNNLSFFQRYKQNNPGKLVMVHYNGTGRRPKDEAFTKFFAGHWLYYRGTKLTQPAGKGLVSATDTLHVADTSVFSMRRHRSGTSDDIAIAVVGADGRPDWSRTEQVRLRSIDASNKTITVERGAYGSRTRGFPRGSYLAAHVTTGPYHFTGGPQEDFGLWSYNFAATGPKDSLGRAGWEALADDLVEKFGPEGELALFDGISIDVLSFVLWGRPTDEIDANADGRADGGVVNGVDVYALGTTSVTRALRERLPGRIILSDGQHALRAVNGFETQRSFGHMNGVESEGFPIGQDFGLNQLSRGQNLFNFWKENSPSPSMNYVNFKYREAGTGKARNEFVEPGLSQDQSYKKMRLALASATFTDAFFAAHGVTDVGIWAPPETLWRAQNTMVRVFDELWRGTDQEPYWLGAPKGPAVSLAEESPDVLGGQGESWPEGFVGRFEGAGLAFARRTQAPGMVVRDVSPSPRVLVLERIMSFALPGIEIPNADLFVSLRLWAEALEGYPALIGRRVYVAATPSGGGARMTSFTWANGRPFTATFNFRDIGPGTVTLGLRVEGDQPVYLERLTAHSAADASYREFENGVVFANASSRPYTFDLGRLFPGASFRRLQGSQNQDPTTNDGRPLGQMLTLRPRDALFAVRTVAT